MSLFEKNIAVLQKRDPELAQRLRNAPRTEPSLIHTAKDDQVRECVQLMKENKIKNIVLIGIGSGRLQQGIHTMVQPRNLIIIEPNIQYLVRLLQHHDMRRQLSDPSWHWLVATEEKDIQTGLLNTKASLVAHGSHLLVNPEVYTPLVYPINTIIVIVKRILLDEDSHLRMRLLRANLCQTNLIANLPSMLRSLHPDRLQGICKEVPALIVGAGPSLDESLDEIAAAKDKLLVICVDTALRTLQKHGIQPHIVVAADPSPANAKHFDEVDLSQDTLLAFVPDCQKAILAQYRDHPHTLCLWDNSTHLTFWMQNALGFSHVFQRALNVSEAAVRLALHFGCNPVAFSGLDLALPPMGGTTHTKEASNALTIIAQESERIQVKKKDGSTEWLSVRSTTNRKGETIYTYPSFYTYLIELMGIMFENPIHWIDCTKGGAEKIACTWLPLSKVVKIYGFTPKKLQQQVAKMTRSAKPDIESALEEIHRAVTVLEQYQTHLQEVSVGKRSPSESVKIWKAFLTDRDLRAWLDHAVFRFQLDDPPIEKLPSKQRSEQVRQHAEDAAHIIGIYIPLIQLSLSHLSPSSKAVV